MLTTLHTLFETRYTELAIAMDEIAERIQALGAFAPGSWSVFSALSNVEEETARLEAKDKIRILGADQAGKLNAPTTRTDQAGQIQVT